MQPYGQEDQRVFSRIERTIAENAKRMIHDLNDNWRVLGVDDATRRRRTENLVAFVQERYDEVVEETVEKVKSIVAEIEALRREFAHLTDALNSNAVTNYDDEETLIAKRDALEKDLEGLRRTMKMRKDKIAKLNEQHERLCASLGSAKRSLPFSPLPDEETVANFETALAAQKEKYNKRTQTFLEKQHRIETLITELEMHNYDSFHNFILKSSVEDFRVTDSNMAQLGLVHENLEEQLENRKSEILKMREHLQSLWERLAETPAYRSSYLKRYSGHSLATKNALIEEINRCEEKKRENFKFFLGKLRAEIVDMWDKCMYGDAQRKRFLDFNYDADYDEAVITSHEEYMNGLKKFYEDNSNIFHLYECRQNLWHKWTELEEKSHEKNRYHNRGGQLLKEEKERKTVSNQLPKIEKDLAILAEEYKNKNGVSFTINGHDLIEIMKSDWQQKDAEKKVKLSARKQLNLPRTPISVPRSAPASRLLPLMNKETLTAVKRRLSPRNSPHSSKYTPISRRLQFTPRVDASGMNRTLRSANKSGMPTVTVTSCIPKKKRSIGRLSSDSKSKKRSRKSKTPSKLSPAEASINSTRYSDFQDHIHNDVNSRSSIAQNLRPRNFEVNKFQTNGNPGMSLEEYKENHSPKSVSKNIRMMDTNVQYNVNVFATPSRPLSKGNKGDTIHRQNTVILSSPSVFNSSRPLRRSNSSHNLRSVLSNSRSKQSPIVKFTSKLDLII